MKTSFIPYKTTDVPRGVEPALHMREGYVFGKTDFECWDKLWKASPSDPEVDGEEWVNFSELMQEYFRGSYEKFPDEFYFWNDFSGDRTLDLKIAKPTVLTARLLSDLQKYLQVNGQKMWRIRIPIYFKPNDSRRVIVVYPNAIDIPPLCPRAAAESCGCNCYPSTIPKGVDGTLIQTNCRPARKNTLAFPVKVSLLGFLKMTERESGEDN